MKRNRASRSGARRVPATPSRHLRWIVFAAAIAAGGAFAALFWPATSVQDLNTPVANPEPFPLPPVAASPYENTHSAARYVGTERCIQCHADQHASYLQTAHSRSLSRVDPNQQPPDGSFHHPASGRRYRAYRNGGAMLHSESLVLPGGQELPLCDYPLLYLVGSGRFARTYLVEDAGFLVESPLTWYASLEKWAMSPGYDIPHHRSFHRTIEHGCLFCHAGQSEPVEGNNQRLELVELAIGCERCHGPGSLHVARHAASRTQPAPEGDRTIVNPSRLPRELAEAVCHQCHLTSEVQVAARGRSPADFRPGLPWQDFAVDFEFGDPATNMTVVGHVAQMRQSRCYQRSDSLTCITCHSPHASVAAAERIAHHRATCQACHVEPACGVALAVRTADNANDCVACHMPQSSTEIPHIAFTHHRIGIHRPEASRAKVAADQLRLAPVLAHSSLPELDRRRALGLAHLQYFRDHDQEGTSRHHLAEARTLISATLAAGLMDAPLAEARAELAAAEGNSAEAARWAATALTGSHLTANERASALRLLAGIALTENRVHEARQHLEELTALRRDPRDWFLLAVSRQRLGDVDGAIAALERVRQIDPAEPETYDMLAELYSVRGDSELAQTRREQARSIREATATRN
jgi:hypothetical protein